MGKKVNYRQLWVESGAKENGVAYSTFYNRVRGRGESISEAARPPRNDRERSKNSCLANQEKDRHTVGFRPLLGDGDRFRKILEEKYPEDTKQDILALIFREWLDKKESS